MKRLGISQFFMVVTTSWESAAYSYFSLPRHASNSEIVAEAAYLVVDFFGRNWALCGRLLTAAIFIIFFEFSW
jgi:hypothetical protein